MLSLNYGSICIFLLLKSFWFETDKWHTTSFHNALETLLHTGNLPPRWYILYLHFSTQRPSGPSNPKRCSKELTRVFSKKFDNIVVCLCELAPSQIRPVTTLWCYTHFIRTLIDRMRPLFTKSGLVFDCEIIDTVARQKGGLCLVHLCVGVQYQACKGCVGHVQCSLRSGIGAGSCQLGPPSRTATGLERVILIEMMNAVCHRALHLWQEKVGNLQPMLQVGTTLCKLWFKFMCF